jgi:hypothetical protein
VSQPGHGFLTDAVPWVLEEGLQDRQSVEAPLSSFPLTPINSGYMSGTQLFALLYPNSTRSYTSKPWISQRVLSVEKAALCVAFQFQHVPGILASHEFRHAGLMGPYPRVRYAA